MRRKIIMISLIFLLLLQFMPLQVAAKTQNVTVTLPDFPVVLNGVPMNSEDSQYPLIVYNYITYFPMTYYGCRFLGLETVYDNESGLTIVTSGVNWSDPGNYQGTKKNLNTYQASLVGMPVTVNGKSIDNQEEEYPLLLFRNVTYFPITWRFAVQEFGWDYSYDDVNGLSIQTSSNNASAMELNLPIASRSDGKKGAFTIAGNHYYYQGEGGMIYQTPIDDLSQKKQVWELPLSDFDEGQYVYANLRGEGNQAILTYHTGGAVMGSDHRILFHDDGTFEDLMYGYSYAYSKKINGTTFFINQGVPPISGNLYEIDETSQEVKYNLIGREDYLYGWSWAVNGGSGSQDMYLVGNDLYVLAIHDKDKENLGQSMIYKVNLQTNQVTKVCDMSASSFTIVDDMVYFKNFYLEEPVFYNNGVEEKGSPYYSQNGYLYQFSLTDGTLMKLTESRVKDFLVMNDHIYYIKQEDEELYRLGEKESINPGGIVSTMDLQEGYLMAVFDEGGSSPYRMMIINQNGKVIYRTIEKVLVAGINQGKVVFVKE